MSGKQSLARVPGGRLLLLPGSHLFPIEYLSDLRDATIFMAEDTGLSTSWRHHKQKIVMFLAAMRSHADALRVAGYTVEYHVLDGPTAGLSYEQRLERTIREREVRELVSFEIEDRSFDARVSAVCRAIGVPRRVLPSPMFLTRPGQLAEVLGGGRPRMADFYRWQRRRLGLLVDAKGQPEGGRWSFDTENRRRLPAGLRCPAPLRAPPTSHVHSVKRLVEECFGDHPGTLDQFAWPTTREGTLRWLDAFLEDRLSNFGPYEDAISSRERVLFHSQLSPMLNCGLLTPAEVVQRAVDRRSSVPLASLEGFVRQVIGWREYVRGVDLLYGERQAMANAFENTRRLRPSWWRGGTGVPPLDDLIESAQETGWAHHIQRLMVAGNIMTLAGVAPAEAYRWFMEMFVDSAEWVMGPNVFGMGIASDGGVMVTKPYVCGSNYMLKMSDYPRGAWCDGVDGLYWNFIDRHRDRLKANPRMANIVRSLDRLDSTRRARIESAGMELQERLTADR